MLLEDFDALLHEIVEDEKIRAQRRIEKEERRNSKTFFKKGIYA